jgi:hypothetical protein
MFGNYAGADRAAQGARTIQSARDTGSYIDRRVREAVLAERERIAAKLRKEAERYFTRGCDHDDRTYGQGMRNAATLAEQE